MDREICIITDYLENDSYQKNNKFRIIDYNKWKFIVINNNDLLKRFNSRIKDIIINKIFKYSFDYVYLYDIVIYENNKNIKIYMTLKTDDLYHSINILMFEVDQKEEIINTEKYKYLVKNDDNETDVYHSFMFFTYVNDKYLKFMCRKSDDRFTMSEDSAYFEKTLNLNNKNITYDIDKTYDDVNKTLKGDIIKIKENILIFNDKIIFTLRDTSSFFVNFDMKDDLIIYKIEHGKKIETSILNNIILDKWTYKNNLYFPMNVRTLVFDMLCIMYKLKMNLDIILMILDKLFNFYEDEYITYHN